MASASVIHTAAASPPPLLFSPFPRSHPFSLPTVLSLFKPKFHSFPPVSATAAGTSTQFLLSPPLPAAKPPFSQASYSEKLPLLCSAELSSSETKQCAIDEYFRLLRLAVWYSDAELLRAVHCLVLKLEEDTFLSNTLIASYLKLGLISDAYRVFKGLSNPNVVSYTTLVSGFAKSSREIEAVGLFFRMRNSGIEPNEFSFVAILTACMRILELELGLQVHALAVKSGCLGNVFVSNALMGLYSKCGTSDFAFQVFDEMSERDVASWNVVISSTLNELMYDRAVELFREMSDGLRADHFTLSTLLAACTDNFDSPRGREIHSRAIRAGLDTSLSLSNALISFYRRCGNQKAVESLFERMTVKDVITWTEMITAYMEFGLVDMAMGIFNRMPEKNAISYNALLAGLYENGEAGSVLDFFISMVEEGLELTEFTLTAIVKACGSLMDRNLSAQIQGFITKFGLRANAHVEAALLDMCTRCGRMEDAENMFTRWLCSGDVRSILSTSMICGYARNGQPDEAISLFCHCRSEGTLVMDEIASTSVLGVCGTLGFLEMGQQIHCHAIKSGIVSDIELANALVSMYSKCWNLDDALEVFRVMPRRDVASWNGLIAGHLLHWQGGEALILWLKMKKLGIKPDKITFLLVISAYRHTKTCLVDECHHLFLSMKMEYNIEPSQEHYASLVGVFGFWGFLERAYEVIISDMPFRPEPSVWRALLDGCVIHSDGILGKKTVKQILSMEPQDPSSYILTANLYSASGRWQCADEVRTEMEEKGFRKFPARSWVIHQNKVVPFYTRDRSHPQSKDIYSGLEVLILECLKAGYVPDTSFVLQEVEEHQKKHFLFYHSAKLAASFGLLMMARPGKPVKIVKNICVCGDCHSFLKYASAVTNRQILLRDSSGFHHFVNGHCSCKDHR